ncbi:MAG TPA: alpha-glucuronidase, partial [Candidatus Limnocylindria bacterium]|nr:alpha-glucuronidase [Candidatus Limnocylindria bacterium]
LGFMVNPSTHYGPSPMGYEFSRWGTYHRADREAIGVDRSGRGTGFTGQYPEPLRTRYDDPASCPERLLLFFHRLRYDYMMNDSRTLLQRVYDDHFEGAAQAQSMEEDWQALRGRVPGDVFGRVSGRFALQARNAREWRDVVNTFFYRLSGVPDAKGRTIHP